MPTRFAIASARSIIRRHIEDEIRTFDRELIRADNICRAALSAALAGTGTEGERQCAADHLHDLMHDVFGKARKDILRRLDEEGGDPHAFPWPIADDEPTSALVIGFQA